MGISGLALAGITGCSQYRPNGSALPFSPLEPMNADEFMLAKGFNYKILVSEQADLGNGLKFGCNNDFISYLL
ncbi:MAG: hypothetical protein R2827_04515 [Bdellovibrionales bacterium]